MGGRVSTRDENPIELELKVSSKFGICGEEGSRARRIFVLQLTSIRLKSNFSSLSPSN